MSCQIQGKMGRVRGMSSIPTLGGQTHRQRKLPDYNWKPKVEQKTDVEKIMESIEKDFDDFLQLESEIMKEDSKKIIVEEFEPEDKEEICNDSFPEEEEEIHTSIEEEEFPEISSDEEDPPSTDLYIELNDYSQPSDIAEITEEQQAITLTRLPQNEPSNETEEIKPSTIERENEEVHEKPVAVKEIPCVKQEKPSWLLFNSNEPKTLTLYTTEILKTEPEINAQNSLINSVGEKYGMKSFELISKINNEQNKEYITPSTNQPTSPSIHKYPSTNEKQQPIKEVASTYQPIAQPTSVKLKSTEWMEIVNKTVESPTRSRFPEEKEITPNNKNTTVERNDSDEGSVRKLVKSPIFNPQPTTTIFNYEKKFSKPENSDFQAKRNIFTLLERNQTQVITKPRSGEVTARNLATGAQNLLHLMNNSLDHLKTMEKTNSPSKTPDTSNEIEQQNLLKSTDMRKWRTGNISPSDENAIYRTPIEEIEDIKQLEILLDSTTQYGQRRRIRDRIREIKNKSTPVEKPYTSFNEPVKAFGSSWKNSGLSVVSVEKETHNVITTSFRSDEGYVSFTSCDVIEDSSRMGDSTWVNGVNLETLEDEIDLHHLLDGTEDFDERKKIRARLKDVMAKHRAQREEMINRREDEREGLLRKKVEDADELKRRTLAMYDAMARSAPAGAQKSIDVNILRTGEITPTGYASPQEKRLDLVEDAIRERARDADERKKKVLAAYDKAAKSGPAGSVKFVDFDNVKPEDISNLENKQPKYSATFEMRGGVPFAPKVSVPRVAPRQVAPERDLMEESIRKRQAEADERKRRTLAAYDQAARSRPAGMPISVYIPQTFDVDPVVSVVDRPKTATKPGQKTSEAANPTPRPPLAEQQQPLVKPPPTGRSTININTQSIRNVSNPYENARPKPFVNQYDPHTTTSQRTVVTTQKTVTPLVQQQQQQRTVTITTQSSRTVQQQQQQQRQQQYYEEDEEEEEEEEEEEDY